MSFLSRSVCVLRGADDDDDAKRVICVCFAEERIQVPKYIHISTYKYTVPKLSTMKYNVFFCIIKVNLVARWFMMFFFIILKIYLENFN